MPEKYRNEVSFEPERARLAPNESTKLIAAFTPLKRKDYTINVPLFTRNLYDSIKNSVGYFAPGSGLTLTNNFNSSGGAMESTLMMNKSVNSGKSIQIVGAGSDGMISISPDNLDFGTITASFSKTLSVVITNKSSCNLYIELRMTQTSKEGMSE